MKVKLKKVHPCWNTLYPDEFVVGDEVVLSKREYEYTIKVTKPLTGEETETVKRMKTIVTTKNGNEFFADDLCASFSNHCCYADIFEKVATHEVLNLVYHENEGQECFEGTLEDCEKFVAEQGNDFLYNIVPKIK